jgi:hypothetical protein
MLSANMETYLMSESERIEYLKAEKIRLENELEIIVKELRKLIQR